MKEAELKPCPFCGGEAELITRQQCLADAYTVGVKAVYEDKEGYRKQSEGKWKKRTFIIFDFEKVGFTCSECNTTWDNETKFCPNCGAKMKGE